MKTPTAPSDKIETVVCSRCGGDGRYSDPNALATALTPPPTNGDVRVEKLDKPEHCGDWHDKPLRWQVLGPRSECQKFSTKRDAQHYASIRRRKTDQLEAINAYR